MKFLRFATFASTLLLLAACGTPGPGGAPTPAAEAAGPVSVNKLSTRPTAGLKLDTEAPAEAPEPEAIDKHCAAIASYARSVATVRDSGIEAGRLSSILTSPPTFPAGPIIREVYARKDIPPQLGEVNSYATCKKVTYQVMLQNLVKAEADHLAAEQRRREELKRAEEAAKKRPAPRPAPTQPVSR